MKVEQICPVCASPEHVVKRRYKQYQFRHCKNCGVAYTHPFAEGSEDQVGESGSSVTSPGYLQMMKDRAKEREALARSMAQNRLREYEKILGRSPRAICEVGPGDGAFSEAYKQLNCDYVGVDVNQEMVEVAQSLGHNVLYGGPEILVKQPKRYDVVFFSQVLEHVQEPSPFLASVWEILSDDGIVHLDVPNHDGLMPAFRKVVPHETEYGFLQFPHHQVAYTSSSLSYLLSASRLKPVFIRDKSNTDLTWGQLQTDLSWKARVAFDVAHALRMGSLLVAVARKSAA